MAARGPLAVQGLHTCARSFSLPPLPAPLSPSRLARRRLKTPLLRPLKPPKLLPTLLLPLPMLPLLPPTLLLLLRALPPTLLLRLRALLRTLLPLLRMLPRRCNFRFGELQRIGRAGNCPARPFLWDLVDARA